MTVDGLCEEDKIARAEYLRYPSVACDPDPRSNRTLEIQHNLISCFNLSKNVPDKIRIQFETAKNIYLYAWFVYRFYPVAESQALVCLELALSRRFIEEIPKEEYYPNSEKPTFRPLLRYAINGGYISNEGFDVWHRSAEMRARERFGKDKLQEMIDKNLSEIECNYDDAVVEDVDRDWDYLKILKKNLPDRRNHYAHGSTMLYGQVLGTFETVSEIINQIYELRKS